MRAGDETDPVISSEKVIRPTAANRRATEVVCRLKGSRERIRRIQARKISVGVRRFPQSHVMIPAMSKALRDTDIDDDAFKSIEAIIHSMTPEERENPKILNGSRRKRIARGSGNEIQEVNRLIKQFAETSKMMKMMSSGKGRGFSQLMKGPRR